MPPTTLQAPPKTVGQIPCQGALDRELLVAVIASRVHNGGPTSRASEPTFAKTRGGCLRAVGVIVFDEGARAFRRDAWRAGLSLVQQAAAEGIAQAIVHRHFPELRSDGPSRG